MITAPSRLLVVLLTCASLNCWAQNDGSRIGIAPSTSASVKSEDHPQKNFLKVNLTAIALKNYSFQYERALNKTVSVAVAFRTMPSTTLPFKKELLKAATNDADAQNLIENIQLSNIAFTPEVRFYLGKKGYGRGFYIAPFYRYAKFKTNQWLITTDENPADKKTINMSGDLTANTGGILFGAQWALGRYICLDWWILGPHYGAGTGNFTGVSNKPLTAAEQQDYRDRLANLDLPLTKETVTVNANGATLKLDGPWGGVRAGISLGIKF